MSSLARRDELLYESDAALRLVDRAIQEMAVPDDDADATAVAAGDASDAAPDLSAAD
jgi:hypothetical protein